MTGGYAGKVLRVNLTNKSISTIDTAKYEEFGGGHGIGSAIFYDLVGDQIPSEGLDPKNVVTLMAAPFSGTFMPGSGRCEVQGIGPLLHPIQWFAHSNFGGRFTAQLKYAGWDGVVVEGASDDPVWINIINDKVSIESAKGVWGMDTWDTQDEISRRVMPNLRHGEWDELSNSYTTQVPAVVCCGVAGENMSRIACLLHGAGSQAALCGFGGVFGSKKLKAISVIGTGSVPIANPKALMEARLWFKQFLWDVDDPLMKSMEDRGYMLINGAPSGGNTLNGSLPLTPARAAACASCPRGCRMRLATADSNESVCAGTLTVRVSGSTKFSRQGSDLMMKYGLGHWAFSPIQGYVQSLYKRGLLGKGKQIECDLPMDQTGTLGFYQILFNKIATRQGIGDVLAEGAARAAEKWGTYADDIKSGALSLGYWGTADHYDPRVEAEWGFGSLMGERDLMLHQIANYPLHWMPQASQRSKDGPYLTAEQAAQITADSMIPYQGDIFMIDYSDNPETGIYSDHKVKQVAWVKHYEKFWIGSGGFCGWRWPMAFTNNAVDKKGPTPAAEPKFWNAVTGKNITFADGMEIGRKIFTLDRAIWTLQGRTRDMEVFPDYIYNVKSRGLLLPMYQNGKWEYATGQGRTLDRAKVEEWKTKFYDFEGFNTSNGWPKRETLEKLGLKKVADALQSKGKLG
jgi:aldehyde:ferredoxin oxidoreductase